MSNELMLGLEKAQHYRVLLYGEIIQEGDVFWTGALFTKFKGDIGKALSIQHYKFFRPFRNSYSNDEYIWFIEERKPETLPPTPIEDLTARVERLERALRPTDYYPTQGPATFVGPSAGLGK